ncbi:hypothetical protein AB4148_00725 [Vibrio sp. 10N.286.51.F4]
MDFTFADFWHCNLCRATFAHIT